MARVLDYARESRQAVGGRRAHETADSRRSHAYEDARDVQLRHECVLEPRRGLAARRRLLCFGGDQADHLSGAQEPFPDDVDQYVRVHRLRASAARRAQPGQPAVGRGQCRHQYVARVEHRDVRRQLRRLPWHLAVEHDAGRQCAGAASERPADHVLLDARNGPSAWNHLLLESGVAHECVGRESLAGGCLADLVVHDGRPRGAAAGSGPTRRRRTGRRASARRRHSAGRRAPSAQPSMWPSARAIHRHRPLPASEPPPISPVSCRQTPCTSGA